MRLVLDSLEVHDRAHFPDLTHGPVLERASARATQLRALLRRLSEGPAPDDGLRRVGEAVLRAEDLTARALSAATPSAVHHSVSSARSRVAYGAQCSAHSTKRSRHPETPLQTVSRP